MYITRVAGMDMFHCPRYGRMGVRAQLRIPIMVVKRGTTYYTGKDYEDAYKFELNELVKERPIGVHNGQRVLFTEEDVNVYNLHYVMTQTLKELKEVKKQKHDVMVKLYHDEELDREELKEILKRKV